MKNLYQALEQAKQDVKAAEWKVFDQLIKSGAKLRNTHGMWWSDNKDYRISNEYRYAFDIEHLEFIKNSGVNYITGSPNTRGGKNVEFVFFGIV